MYITGTGANACDLLEAIDDVLTVKLGASSWAKVQSKQATYAGVTRTSEVTWCGKGDGNDKIYVQMRIPSELSNDGLTYNITDSTKIALDALAGYDAELSYYEQPGCIQQWLKSNGAIVAQPTFTCGLDTKYTYWVFANTQRIVVVIKLSTVYESMYVGFINPVSSERQYPYPMYVGGNGVFNGASWPANTNGSFLFPSAGSGYIRRADGVWRAFDAYGDASTVPNPFSIGTVFPYNTGNKKLVPNYYSGDVGDLDNALMMPVLLCSTAPYDINGMLDSVFFVSGTRDIAAEQILTYGTEQYIVFSVKDMHDANTYFAVKLE